MNPTTSKRIVLVAMTASLAVVLSRPRASTYKSIWALGVIGVVLSAVADFAPSIAGPFSVLVLAGYLTPQGRAAVGNIVGAAIKQPAAPVQPHERAGGGAKQ